MSNNKNNKNDDDDDDKVCQSQNTAVTTGSIFFPHRSDFGGTELTHLFDTMQLYRLATCGLNGDSDASLSKHFTALLSSPTQWSSLGLPPANSHRWILSCRQEREGFPLRAKSILPSKSLSKCILQLQPPGCKFERNKLQITSCCERHNRTGTFPIQSNALSNVMSKCKSIHLETQQNTF